ncbi:putative glycerate kinase [Catonella morbi ATCC 51271]|uniref:Putative glycerate kinase n=1 Tax=Catonella morbi ATCC 51271 TaxID=592026 RepID=V2Y0K8_9FIRM|nr:glycerate kinase [Catonella morbi]ESL02518.1 putative glycerate kinase [Catonella morbi ATCC 51271]
MKVTVAVDSFKGSLSSLKAGEAIKKGILISMPEVMVTVRPLADGGEGTVEALIFAIGGIIDNVKVMGPLGEKIEARYGIIKESKTAVIEMSEAAGITLISEEKRNPLNTTTYGVGELIKAAVNKGCRNFIVGIGGSSTNDGGAGMLQALGFGLLNNDGNQIPLGAKGLKDLVMITDNDVLPELKECNFKIACDVTNQLCGKSGCSTVFGPQKGATSEMIKDMDSWLKRFARLTKNKYASSDAKLPGTGAAGGLGFAFLSYTNSSLKSGIDIVIEETRLEDYIKEADIVITGEGRLDGQTVFGKAPVGVAKLAKKYEKKVIAFAGSVTKDAIVCNDYGIDAFFPVLRRITSLKEAMKSENAAENLSDTVTQVFNLIKMSTD